MGKGLSAPRWGPSWCQPSQTTPHGSIHREQSASCMAVRCSACRARSLLTRCGSHSAAAVGLLTRRDGRAACASCAGAAAEDLPRATGARPSCDWPASLRCKGVRRSCGAHTARTACRAGPERDAAHRRSAFVLCSAGYSAQCLGPCTLARIMPSACDLPCPRRSQRNRRKALQPKGARQLDHNPQVW